MKKTKKKTKFSKFIVTLVILLNVAFAIATFVTFWHVGSEPTVLVGAWFAFTGTELLSLASITKKEKATANENAEEEDILEEGEIEDGTGNL